MIQRNVLRSLCAVTPVVLLVLLIDRAYERDDRHGPLGGNRAQLPDVADTVGSQHHDLRISSNGGVVGIAHDRFEGHVHRRNLMQSADFSIAEIGQSNPLASASNTITVTLQPTTALPYLSNITISGLAGTQTGDTNALMLNASDGSGVLSFGRWTMSGVLEMQIGSQGMSQGVSHVVSFEVQNGAQEQSSPTVFVSATLEDGTSMALQEAGKPGVAMLGVQNGSNPLRIVIPRFTVSDMKQTNPFVSASNNLVLTLQTNTEVSRFSQISIYGLTGFEPYKLWDDFDPCPTTTTSALPTTSSSTTPVPATSSTTSLIPTTTTRSVTVFNTTVASTRATTPVETTSNLLTSSGTQSVTTFLEEFTTTTVLANTTSRELTETWAAFTTTATPTATPTPSVSSVTTSLEITETWAAFKSTTAPKSSTSPVVTTAAITSVPTTAGGGDATTSSSTTDAPTSSSSTGMPTTSSSTTSVAPTTSSTTVAPTTSTTPMPTTSSSTTTSVAPTTSSTTTNAPTTSSTTTTVAPTTSSSTVAPTTSSTTTTVAPTTSSSTVAPTTSSTTTSVAPTTSSSTITTVAPTTSSSSTVAPTTAAPTTVAPTTSPSVAVDPSTSSDSTAMATTSDSATTTAAATTAAATSTSVTTLQSGGTTTMLDTTMLDTTILDTTMPDTTMPDTTTPTVTTSVAAATTTVAPTTSVSSTAVATVLASTLAPTASASSTAVATVLASTSSSTTDAGSGTTAADTPESSATVAATISATTVIPTTTSVSTPVATTSTGMATSSSSTTTPMQTTTSSTTTTTPIPTTTSSTTTPAPTTSSSTTAPFSTPIPLGLCRPAGYTPFRIRSVPPNILYRGAFFSDAGDALLNVAAPLEPDTEYVLYLDVRNPSQVQASPTISIGGQVEAGEFDSPFSAREVTIPNEDLRGVPNGCNPLLTAIGSIQTAQISQSSPFVLSSNTLTVTFRPAVEVAVGSTIVLTNLTGAFDDSTSDFTSDFGFAFSYFSAQKGELGATVTRTTGVLSPDNDYSFAVVIRNGQNPQPAPPNISIGGTIEGGHYDSEMSKIAVETPSGVAYGVVDGALALFLADPMFDSVSVSAASNPGGGSSQVTLQLRADFVMPAMSKITISGLQTFSSSSSALTVLSQYANGTLIGQNDGTFEAIASWDAISSSLVFTVERQTQNLVDYSVTVELGGSTTRSIPLDIAASLEAGLYDGIVSGTTDLTIVTGANVNSAPSFDLSQPNLTLVSGVTIMDGQNFTIPHFVTNMNSGIFPEDIGQVLQLVVSYSNVGNVPIDFISEPAITVTGSSGNLSFSIRTQALNDAQYHEIVLSIALRDDGGTLGGGINVSTKLFPIIIVGVPTCPASTLSITQASAVQADWVPSNDVITAFEGLFPSAVLSWTVNLYIVETDGSSTFVTTSSVDYPLSSVDFSGLSVTRQYFAQVIAVARYYQCASPLDSNTLTVLRRASAPTMFELGQDAQGLVTATWLEPADTGDGTVNTALLQGYEVTVYDANSAVIAAVTSSTWGTSSVFTNGTDAGSSGSRFAMILGRQISVDVLAVTAAGQGSPSSTTVRVGSIDCDDTCGDSRRNQTEGCDDGNTVAGDGCSGTCSVETAYLCTQSTALWPCSTGSTGFSVCVIPIFSSFTIGQDNTIQTEPNQMYVVIRANFPLAAGTQLTISGLTGSATPATSSLAVTGVGGSSLATTGQWDPSPGSLVFTLSSAVAAGASIAFSFILTNPAVSNSAVAATISCSSCSADPTLAIPSISTPIGLLGITVKDRTCPTASMYGDACDQTCFGIVSGSLCVCRSGQFGDDCSETGTLDTTQSVAPTVLTAGRSAVVKGSTGIGVSFPAGAIPGDIVVSVSVYAVKLKMSKRQSSLEPIGSVTALKPDNVKFSVPVTISLSVNLTAEAEARRNGKIIVMMFLNTTTNDWQEVGGTVDTNTGLMDAESDHFSLWTVMAAPDPNAQVATTPDGTREIVKPDSGGLSTAELAGIIVGSVVGLILLLLLIYFIVFRTNLCGVKKDSDVPAATPAKYMGELEVPEPQPATRAQAKLPEEPPADGVEADLAFVELDVDEGVNLSATVPPGIIVPDLTEIEQEEEEPRRESIVGDLVYPMVAVRASQKDSILLFT